MHRSFGFYVALIIHRGVGGNHRMGFNEKSAYLRGYAEKMTSDFFLVIHFPFSPITASSIGYILFWNHDDTNLEGISPSHFPPGVYFPSFFSPSESPPPKLIETITAALYFALQTGAAAGDSDRVCAAVAEWKEYRWCCDRLDKRRLSSSRMGTPRR